MFTLAAAPAKTPINIDSRIQKAAIVDRMEALAMFSPKKVYVARHAK